MSFTSMNMLIIINILFLTDTAELPCVGQLQRAAYDASFQNIDVFRSTRSLRCFIPEFCAVYAQQPMRVEPHHSRKF